MDVITRKYQLEGEIFQEEMVRMEDVIAEAENAMKVMKSFSKEDIESPLANITKASLCDNLGIMNSDLIVDSHKTAYVNEGIGSTVANAIKSIWKKITSFFKKLFGGGKDGDGDEASSKASKAKKLLRKDRKLVLKAVRDLDINVKYGLREDPLKDFSSLMGVLKDLQKKDEVNRDLFGLNINIKTSGLKSKFGINLIVKDLPSSGTKLNAKSDAFIVNYVDHNMDLLIKADKLFVRLKKLQNKGGNKDENVTAQITKITAQIMGKVSKRMSSNLAIAHQLNDVVNKARGDGKKDKGKDDDDKKGKDKDSKKKKDKDDE